ncbi:hypothetical protein CFP65_7077 [Kitasatospora sp. MMS16-BH015]|uniref:cation:proton antiporter n=1 Tax=Kitasatospora sp. MMS16-BH015 TaxID=2018025 RepID=UPI000CA26E3C|nr:monovalent cation/H(+) antiporter subunit G [Kitasatospora sp. MMS16-BH015]AUG81681.1 hypothetical protein CFP65_7077 [Kitasatospora sp. MMS16-BH015]
MNAWLLAAAVLALGGLGPCLLLGLRGAPQHRLAALNLASAVTTTVLLLLAQGFSRPSYTDLALALLWPGTAALLLAAVALIRLPGPYTRLHALSIAGTLGVPLIALALAVDTGPGRAAVKLLVIGLLSAVGGTVTTMAVGRTTRLTDEFTDRGAGR